MKAIFALGLFAAAGLSGIGQAHAATALNGPQLAAPSVQLVEGGCGPGGFRDRFGYCRPRRYLPPPPPRCPPYTHPTPYGCRRNF